MATIANMMNSDPSAAGGGAPVHVRRKRYSGKNPRKFSEKYKELNPHRFPDIIEKVAASGKTPAGTHIPVLMKECLDALQLAPGMTGVDGRLGFGGHAREILRRIVPHGKLIGQEVDPIEQLKTSKHTCNEGCGHHFFEAVSSNHTGHAKTVVS